jgi:hypothetical protein
LEGLAWAHRRLTPPPLQALELAGSFWRNAATYHLINTGAIDAFHDYKEWYVHIEPCLHCMTGEDRPIRPHQHAQFYPFPSMW